MSTAAARPAHVSFADDCFEIVGETVEYLVGRSALHPGPARFADRAEAEEYARRTGRQVVIQSRPVLRRVRWV